MVKKAIAIKEKTKIKVEKRKVVGRQVKKLRRQGILPANVYGKTIKSQAVQVNLKDFLSVYQRAGETGVVDLQVEGDEKTRPVLIHNVQLDSVTDLPLHADFYQVSLTEKITSEIPVEIIGKSPAIDQNIGVLIQPLSEVEVEALPTDLPDKFEVDVSSLKEIDQAVTVADLKVPAGVTILTAAKQILVKIEPPAKEEEVKPVEEAVPAEGEEAAPVEGKEAGKPVETSQPAGQGKPGEAAKSMPEVGKPPAQESRPAKK